jgi:glycosyltransferase involved in cell wall biosynthesis
MRGIVRQVPTSLRGAERSGQDGLAIGLVSPLPPQLGGVVTVARWLLDHENDIGCHYVTFDLERPTDETGGRFRVRALGNQLGLLARFLPWARRAPSVTHCMVSSTLTGLSRDLLYLGVLTCLGRRIVSHVQVVRPTVPWWRLTMRAVGGLTTEVIVVGTAAKAALAELGVASRVVPNAVPFPPATPVREETGSCRPFRLLFVGTFGERKGCHELLKAMALLRDAGLDCRLDIVGREEHQGEEERLRSDVKTYALGEAVNFLGQRAAEELPSLYAVSDVFCLPSRLEGLPLALIEAMAYGLPVVATPVGCVEDLVTHGKTGLLARVGDPVSLTEQLSLLARDPDLRHELGQNGARHVATNMGPDVIVAAWHEIYSSLLRRSAQSHR